MIRGEFDLTKIKFCGLRTIDDVHAANEIFPEYVGFVFAPKSKRLVTSAQAEKLRNALSKKILAVGVFVNAEISNVAELLNAGIIDAAQLHGSEDNAYIKKIRDITRKPIIKAFKIKSADDVRTAQKSIADFILVDAGAGDGKTFDWSLLKNLRREYFLAGGLTADNVIGAIEMLHPFAVDVSSGIELDGRKNFDKMKTFASAVRSMNRI